MSDFNLLDVLSARHSSPSAFNRSVYKNTDCGASVGLLVVSPGSVERWVYGDALRDLGTFDEMSAAGCEVAGVKVSSIVEGSDAEVFPRTITEEDFKSYVDAAEFWSAFDALVSEVDAEAGAIFDEVNGPDED